MNLTKIQNRFINNKHVGYTLLRGKKSTGKTIASVYRAINLENNYCIYPGDKILYVTKEASKKSNVIDIYNSEKNNDTFYSLFSSTEDRVEVNYLEELLSQYSKAYHRGRNLKLINKERAFEIMDSEYFNEVLEEYSKKSKLISKMSLEEIYDEILWIKACNFTGKEYGEASRNGRKRIIRKNSFSREFLYMLMEIYNAEMMDAGFKDIYDDAIAAKKYASKYDEKYSHIIIDDVEELTRGEIEFLKSISIHRDYSSIVFVVNNELSTRENSWLVKGRKLKELGADFKGKAFSLKTEFVKLKKNIDYMDSYQYIDLKHKNVLEFKLDNGSSNKEIYIDNENNFNGRELKAVPVYNEIAAGTPIEIQEEMQEAFYLPKTWMDKENDDFILKVKGDSMIGKNINDGDLVVIRRQNTAYQNDIVAVNLDGAATLKTLSFNDGEAKLMPANPKYQAITLRDKNAEILGIAIGVIKNKN